MISLDVVIHPPFEAFLRYVILDVHLSSDVA